MRVVVHIEGGGDNKMQQIELRQAFEALFRRAGFEGKMPRVDCSGSREQAKKDYLSGRKQSDRHAMLLVDAEAAVADGASSIAHLQTRDRWDLDASTENDVHLMVQLMESWFFADRTALQAVFGAGFNPSHLPGTERDIESIRKSDVESGLSNATRATKDGPYDRRTKGRLGPRILSRIDPRRVEAASPHAKRFFDRMRELATR